MPKRLDRGLVGRCIAGTVAEAEGWKKPERTRKKKRKNTPESAGERKKKLEYERHSGKGWTDQVMRVTARIQRKSLKRGLHTPKEEKQENKKGRRQQKRRKKKDDGPNDAPSV
jgi:hypothetical protein